MGKGEVWYKNYLILASITPPFDKNIYHEKRGGVIRVIEEWYAVTFQHTKICLKGVIHMGDILAKLQCAHYGYAYKWRIIWPYKYQSSFVQKKFNCIRDIDDDFHHFNRTEMP